jgi:hypothetical protein
MPRSQVPEPWKSFLFEIDASLTERVELECIGGFVVAALYGLPRPTADVDVLSIAPATQRGFILGLAGRGSPLHRKYGLHIEFVAVAAIPEDYEERLTEMFPGSFPRLRLLALDPYDIALSKLERNSQRDRDDVKFMAEKVPFDLQILQQRYEKELRPNLGNPGREDLTLQLWIEAIGESRGQERKGPKSQKP